METPVLAFVRVPGLYVLTIHVASSYAPRTGQHELENKTPSWALDQPTIAMSDIQ